MPFNAQGPTVLQGGYVEILKFPVGDGAMPSIVIDASTVASTPDGVRKLKGGTLLSKNSNGQYERYTGASGQAIKCVLAYDVEVYDESANSDVPAAGFFHGCVFRADRIVDFDTLGDDAREALFTCRFE